MTQATFTVPIIRLSAEAQDCDLDHLQREVMRAIQGSDADATIDLSGVPVLPMEAMEMLRRVSAHLRNNRRRLLVVTSRHPEVRSLEFDSVWASLGGKAPQSCTGGNEPVESGAGCEPCYREQSLSF